MIKANILTQSLKDITDQVISINKFGGEEINTIAYNKPAHRRDDHYLFIFQKKGNSKIVVDFREVELSGNMLLCVLPGQVHYGVSVCENTEAWLITVDINLISDDYSRVFNGHYFQSMPLTLAGMESLVLERCIELIASVDKEKKELGFVPQVQHSLISACIGIFASAYEKIETDTSTMLRTQILTKQFKTMLLRHFKTHKSTSDYAFNLNVSPAYLNEAVKVITGFPVSFWIQQATITEAKRLLYATDITVKEIAYKLGFSDHAYFTRYFSKAEAQSPSRFRMNSRK